MTPEKNSKSNLETAVESARLKKNIENNTVSTANDVAEELLKDPLKLLEIVQNDNTIDSATKIDLFISNNHKRFIIENVL